MPDLSAIQWAGLALVAAGLLWWLAPQIRERLKSLLPAATATDPLGPDDEQPAEADEFVALCWRLDAIQRRLEDLGHEEMARLLDEVYGAMRQHSEAKP